MESITKKEDIKMKDVKVTKDDKQKYFNMFTKIVENFDKTYFKKYDINSDTIDELIISVDVNNDCSANGLSERFNNELLHEYMRLFAEANPEITVKDDSGITTEYEENQDFTKFQYDVSDLIVEDIKEWLKINLGKQLH